MPPFSSCEELVILPLLGSRLCHEDEVDEDVCQSKERHFELQLLPAAATTTTSSTTTRRLSNNTSTTSVREGKYSLSIGSLPLQSVGTLCHTSPAPPSETVVTGARRHLEPGRPCSAEVCRQAIANVENLLEK